MKCLLVIDMQEDYVGIKRNKFFNSYDNPEDLIKRINSKISEYSNDKVFYILNQFIFEPKDKVKNIVSGLEAVSDNIFIKRKSNSFSNQKLLDKLNEMNIKDIELVGVDGNYCIAATALNAYKMKFNVYVDSKFVGTRNEKKFSKTKAILQKEGINII